MSHSSQRKVTFAAAAAGILLAATVAGAWGYRHTQETMQRELVKAAQQGAIAVQAEELSQLAGTRADWEAPVYRTVKERLRRLRDLDPRMRYTLFRQLPGAGTIMVLADSEQSDSLILASPGDPYPEAPLLPGLQATLATGEPAAQGPFQDSFGAWVAAYAAVENPASGLPREILGLSIAAADWRAALWRAALRAAGVVGFLLGLPLLGWIAWRRQREQNEAIRNLSEAMEQSHSAVMIMDLDHRIEYANAGFCAQIGHPRRELIGRSWSNFQAAETPAETLADLKATLRNGLPWTGEWLNRRKDGSIYPVRGIVSPVKRRDGALTSYVAVFEDTTERKRRDAELREAKERAEAGGRAKSQFLTTMSHEVRTPLNGIVGFTSLLLDMPLAPEQREYVQTIRASAAALVNLTGDILDFARIESGKLALDPGPCDLRACVEDALDLAAGLAAEKHLELLHWVDDDVPPVIVADSGRLRQALSNLVNNGVKFTAGGEVEVRVRVCPPGSNSPTLAALRGEETQIEFSVRDTGIGIAPEHHAVLFKPFTQIDPSMTRRFGGTGLGLVISKTLVELMAGKIAFTSELGRGSTFTFTVRAPIYQEEQHIRAAPASSRPLAGRRLALVTRAPGLRGELTRLVTSWGAEVLEVDYSALVFNVFDLALVDVDDALAKQLPVIRPDLKRLPPQKLFGLVAFALPTSDRQELRAHFRLLVNKPVHHTTLLTLLLSALPAPGAPALSPVAIGKSESAPQRESASEPVAVVTAPVSPPVEKAPPLKSAALVEPIRRAAPPATIPPTSEEAHFPVRLLLVEDNPVNQRLMQAVLNRIGCRWNLAENGQLALEELPRDRYEVVLMDLHMPEMDGLTAIQKIREGGAGTEARDIWIIALTADARDDQREKVFAAGANNYLMKPLRRPELNEALQQYLAAKRARE